MASCARRAADFTRLRKRRADASRVVVHHFAIDDISPLNQSRTICRFRTLRLDRQLPCSCVVNNNRTPSSIWVLLVLSILVLAPSQGSAQEAAPSSLPPGWITPTPKGLVA